jgi:ELWxxDGT repeat protein
MAGTQLIRTFNPTFRSHAGVSTLTQVGGVAILAASNSDYLRNQLWRTDGTTAGTYLLSSVAVVTPFVVVNNVAIFAGIDPATGIELWKTDGTAAGTVMIKDINPGSWSSSPDDLTVAGNLLFFVADDGVHGREVWRSDGTADGTFIVRDINPGPPSSIGGDPYMGDPNPLTAARSQVFFDANDGTRNALWVTDGTTAGTHMVIGAAPGSGRVYAFAATASGSGIYFNAYDTADNLDLWRSDGSPSGTFLVQQIDPPGVGTFMTALTTLNGLFFFVAGDGSHVPALWATDGTTSGTAMLRDINPLSGSGFGHPSFVIWGSTLYLFADDGIHGVQLWRTNGTTAGTVEVTAVSPFLYGLGPRVVNGVILFNGTDSQHGSELWRSDGTGTGTFLVKDVNPGTIGSAARADDVQFVSFQNMTYFTATTNELGVQLWKPNGTAAGTAFVAQFGSGLWDRPSDFTVFGNALYFVANNGQLWKTDGTTVGTVPIAAGLFPDDLTAFNGALYFASAGTNMGLWKTDGTANGTVPVANTGDEITSFFVVTRGTLYFETEFELWKSDGTGAGTTVLQVLSSTPPNLAPSLLGVNGELYYSSNADGQGWQLWKTDGTTAGTMLVKVLYPGFDANLTDLINVNGTIYFLAQGADLWRSDGTSAGTQLVYTFNPPVGEQLPANLASVGGQLFLTGGDATHGDELWRSDGTTTGTRMVADIAPGSTSSWPRDLTAFNGLLYFTADDGVHGRDLWQSNGTAVGTSMIPIGKNENGASAGALAAIGNTLYFFADDGVHGLEPWTLRVTGGKMPTDVAMPEGPDGGLPDSQNKGDVAVPFSRFAVQAESRGNPDGAAGHPSDSSVATAFRLSSKQVDALFGWLSKDGRVWDLEDGNALS